MSIIQLDKSVASQKLHKLPFPIKHGLADHRLFTLANLVDLAKKMPRDQIEFSSGDLEVGQTGETTPQLDMAPQDVIRQIEQHNAWMVIKRVEGVPEYHAVLKEFVDGLFEAAGIPDQKYTNLEGYIFVSSANATTPFHVDAEENILVQIRGDKLVHVFDNDDCALVSEKAMEITPSKYRNQRYEASFEDRAEIFNLQPGDGLHIPWYMPHWVRVADQYSVSMAMTWKTPEVVRGNKIRLMNGTLRDFGWPQKAPGVSPVFDSFKVGIHDSARLIIDPLRKSEKIRSLLRGLIYGKKANYYYNKPAE
ncbi:hypothetical protein MNBD_ALPHA08-2394 [hydrothermal vent metagenome]|uniref:JmjC domain-containing protein n=1 Tax=hydrothermal vent metagenome TaxID=652676 RepID=A0A3B0RLG2_9ZZZZ